MISWRRHHDARRTHGDHGDGPVGYLAVLLLIASIAGALLTSGLPGVVSRETTQAICRVTQGECTEPAAMLRSGPQAVPKIDARFPVSRNRVGPWIPFEIRASSINGRKAAGTGPARLDNSAPTGDPEIDGAYEYMTTVGKYFWDRFRRSSADDKGSPIWVAIVTKEELAPMYDGRAPSSENAMWAKGTTIDSLIVTDKMVALDVIAHEFSHGLVSHTADLAPNGQSGELDEAIADIFASNLDTGDWEIGEDTDPGAVRDMSNPRRFKHPAHVRDYEATKDRHFNSTIISHAYFQMVQDKDIGRKAAEQIVYRAVTKHLTSHATFEDFRTANLRAAQELYGKNSRRYRGVNAAFAKVGLNGGWKAPLPSAGGNNSTGP